MFDFWSATCFRWTYYWVLLITIYRNSWLISGFWDRKHLVNVTEVSGKSLGMIGWENYTLARTGKAEIQNERAALVVRKKIAFRISN